MPLQVYHNYSGMIILLKNDKQNWLKRRMLTGFSYFSNSKIVINS